MAERLEVLVIGSGFGGIAMAHQLDALAVDDYLIVEKAASPGGTWRDNTYPGAACDVPSHLYSLSFAANPGWSRLFPRQQEIRAHLEQICKPLIERGRVRFGWTVRSMRWQRETSTWRVENTRGELIEARFVVAAMADCTYRTGLIFLVGTVLPGRIATVHVSIIPSSSRANV